jgi:tRNA(adenine34) deaminase
MIRLLPRQRQEPSARLYYAACGDQGTKNLSECTIYINVEPCAMCSFCIRETGICRVVYAIPSPIMGGYSKWNILGDLEISNTLPEIFRGPPEIVSSLLEAEAEQVWREWHPVDWAVLRHRHAIGKTSPAGVGHINRASAAATRAMLSPYRRRSWSDKI